MSDQTCPQCGAPSSGNFCARCGASLGDRACPACGVRARPGHRFCTSCGAALGGGAPAARPAAGGAGGGGSAGGGSSSGGDGALGWWVAGLLMVALILFLLVPVLSPNRGRTDGGAADAGQPAQGPMAGAPGDASSVDLSSMTPRQAADRLFERVMRSVEGGDSTQAQNFLPMAIAAYERARPLNLDGLFHLSILQRTALDFQAALETAREGLEEEPDHVLLLSAAAEAAREMGDSATAREHFAHLLEVYDQEVSSDRQDYQAHGQLLPRLRDDAEAFLEGS